MEQRGSEGRGFLALRPRKVFLEMKGLGGGVGRKGEVEEENIFWMVIIYLDFGNGFYLV